MKHAWNRMGWVTAGVLALLVVAAITGIVSGGPLDPPGPPGSTQPQVEPRTPVQSLPGSATAQYVVSQPGSYFLTGNITGVSGKDAIVITADDVTLDLNGFTIRGVSGVGNAISDGGAAHVRWAIRNGTIDSFWNRGINAGNVGYSTFEDLRVNGADTAILGGSAITARRIVAQANASYGLTLGAVAMVSDCFVDGSGDPPHGVSAGDQSTIERCTTVGDFLRGINVGPGSRVIDCNVRFADIGVSGDAGATVRGCTIGGTSIYGVLIGANSSVVENLIDTGYRGVSAGASTRIEDNEILNMTTGIMTSGAGLAIGNRLRAVATPIVNTTCVPYCSQIGAVVGANSGNPDANVAY